ncbi:homocysteine methyltransferase [Thermosipho melanesiensis]|uniref:Methionine synthase n=1 Tax=Thermosipho melanesiensis TaxID=46541 RepID=A0ABM6GDS9_9BACT|nr:homocysteine methyltransferase [Thermosipho melanesiensis]OOC35674.1 homocysteine methyltransferase [Thermosipho melanesiensis]OOC38973.1 homocysteine methyltransferase [Thermosipho melanesiensis]OOC39121.1 homocysteine methyltransferase [Thermosipho melanesiensis]OOC41648.1 homocysteine methyltransferase [Thermosipho melanesiensis]
MERKEFLELLNERIYFLDGAYGTEFFKLGFKEVIETLNVTNSEMVYALQKAYVDAGVDFLLTNTFSANRLKLSSLKVKYNLKDINYNAVKIAKKARKDKKVYILGDISSTGYLISPLGELTFDEAYEVFKEQGEILLNSGIDGFILETMSDLKELKAAILALRDLSKDVPIIVQMTFDEDGVAVTGTSVEIFSTLMNDLDVDVVGINCTLEPEKLLPVFKQLSNYSRKPISVEPNAGKPKLLRDGSIVYNTSPEKFALYMEDFVEFGANIVGGCCGTSPEHIRLMVEFLKEKKPKKREIVKEEFVSSRTKLKKMKPFLIIGERINAAGKKKFQQKIRERNYNKIVELAILQEKEGAHVLDLNLGIEKLLDKTHFSQVVNTLDKISSLPLSLDIQEFEFMEMALKEYVGRPIINSSTAKRENLDKAIYLLKRYGGILILLTMKDKIPESAKERFDIALEAIRYLEKHDIEKERVIVDPLVLPLGAKKDPAVTIKTIELLSKEGINTSIGLSNLSFGMPNREALNSSFLALCIDKGLTAAILNTSEKCTMNAVFGSLTLKGVDFEKKEIIRNEPMIEMILNKKEDELKREIEKLLEEYTPLQISQDILSKKMEYIGELYSKGEIYLPQLILAAETVTPIFEYLNSLIESNAREKLGTVVLATVEGDVHDIGKRIVGTVLKSSGINVIDLGKDVPAKEILKAVKEYKPDIVGLSAMMTTTIGRIKEVKDLFVDNNVDIPIISGGASMNKEIADNFGVYYAKNASQALKLVKKILKR